jgi:hypothetical protein
VAAVIRPSTRARGSRQTSGAGTSLLADGRVLVMGGNLHKEPAHVSTGLNTVFTFDPWTESWDSHEPMRQGRWYPTQLLMPDARTLIASGLSASGDPDFGSLGPSGSATSPSRSRQAVGVERADRPLAYAQLGALQSCSPTGAC